MSLELLGAPHMDKFFGEDAARFNRIHLTQALTFIGGMWQFQRHICLRGVTGQPQAELG